MIVTMALSGVWLTDLTGESLNLEWRGPRPSVKNTVEAGSKDYAGRRRNIRGTGRTARLPIDLTWVTEEQLAKLQAWAGHTLLLRTDMWRRWGLYADWDEQAVVPYTNDVGESGYNLTLEWEDVDRDEAV